MDHKQIRIVGASFQINYLIDLLNLACLISKLDIMCDPFYLDISTLDIFIKVG